MAVRFFQDDDHKDGGIGRPVFDATTGIKSATTGAGITELDISGLNIAANRTVYGDLLLRVSNVGANPCFFSLGPAATAPGANTAMVRIQANSVQYFRAISTDLSVYHQQITGTTTLEVAVIK